MKFWPVFRFAFILEIFGKDFISNRFVPRSIYIFQKKKSLFTLLVTTNNGKDDTKDQKLNLNSEKTGFIHNFRENFQFQIMLIENKESRNINDKKYSPQNTAICCHR